MSTARYALAGADVNGKFYAIGGWGNGQCDHDADVEAYDPTTQTWSTRASIPHGLYNPGNAVVDGKLYLVGGNAGCVESKITYVYDPVANTWTTAAPTLEPRYGSQAASVGSRIYVFGGTSGSETDAEVYRPVTNTWSAIAPIPYPKSEGHAVANLGGKIFIVGGYGPGGGSKVDVYDPATNTWSARSPSPLSETETRVAVIGGILYAFQETGANHPWAYDPATDTWTELAAEPYKQQPGVAAVSGVIYVAGGYDGAPLAGVRAFTPLYAGNHVPDVVANGPYRGSEGASIDFQATADDADGDDLTFLWDFGDGETSTSAAASHTYADDGDYVVTVTASDGEKTRTATTHAIVRNVRPTLDGIVKATISGGQTYSASGTIADPGEETFTATVDWGEGGGAQPHPVVGSSISLNHQYNTPGYFNLVVTVSDGDGGVVTVSRWIRVKVPPA